MRTLVSLVSLVLLAVATHAAHAGPPDFRYQLGQKVRQAKPVAVTLFGCKGEITPRVAGGRVIAVEFTITFDDEHPCGELDDADATSLVAVLRDRITAVVGGSPVENAQYGYAWPGADATVLEMPGGDTPDTAAVVWIVKPDAALACWPNDGFAAMWSTFTEGLARGDATSVATTFRFPFPDRAGYGHAFRDARAFARSWREVFDDAFVKGVGDPGPWCTFDPAGSRYTLLVGNELLTATRSHGAWRWTSFEARPKD
jgi:hypothetical protein